MEQINIRWLGHTGLIVKRCVPKGASIEERFTNLLEISTARGEYVVTAPHLGRVAWIRRPGVVMRGEVVARMWAELPEREGPVSDWQPVKVYAQPTQTIPSPYALTTEVNPHPYKVTAEESAFIREFAKGHGLAVGDALRMALYGLATMPQEEQKGLIQRFQEALGAV